MRTQIKRYYILLLVFVAPVFAQGLSVETNRADAVYAVGSQAVFTISGAEGGAIEYVLSNDGKDILRKGMIQCETGDVGIAGTLDKPGFLLCSVTFISSEEGKKQKIAGGAAFEPEKIKPADNHMPADFDAFWQQKKEQLSTVSMNPVLTPEPEEEAMVMYDVHLDSVGKPVRGYYAKPVDAAKGSCPAIAFFQGAGVYSAGKTRIREYCKEGFIAFEINAHGLPNGQPKEFYRNLHKTTLKNYKYFGREDRDTSYFIGMYLRVYRALEFLKAQPEWDGKNLVVWGPSQGGAQSIAAAGLDPAVTFVFAAVPAMCDHGGYINGWPRLATVEKGGCYDPTILNASKYVDGVNFASGIRVPGFFTVGFIDQICRPTSVYAMYNTFAGPKEIFQSPTMAHKIPAEQQQMAKERILKQVK